MVMPVFLQCMAQKKNLILLKCFEFAEGIECNEIVQYIVYTFVLNFDQHFQFLFFLLHFQLYINCIQLFLPM